VSLDALEGGAVQLIDAAIEQVEPALGSFRSGDLGLARSVRTASGRARGEADGLYESALTLMGESSSPRSGLRRQAALLHVVRRVRHVHSELATIADQTARAGDPGTASDEHDRALAAGSHP
jgi:hypothetical protein